ncbi:cupin domain-containing protein [Sphingomonas ginsenosidivorax]|uniref:Cupin domain-containing protein n=1 Tax=Sphingomonas ginsenosidivorax TaxID=862135 RepID=A0A5C6U582_9SPHN|nr:cupin domain-containing protein [Sphingomonas ginsenosidivorax]TXC68017.1 cupin domain-containing protein [Sphingomonas ginsenosidivorax]
MTKTFMFAGLLALTGMTSPASAQDAGVKGVTRTILGSGQPVAASGLELSLRRVVFAPGAKIPGEVHSGMQVIYVLSGRLSLRVLGGSAVVRKALPDGSMGPPMEVKAGPNPVILSPGDTALENETLVLAPSNPSKEPLVILAGSLMPVGKPQSVQITEPVSIP